MVVLQRKRMAIDNERERERERMRTRKNIYFKNYLRYWEAVMMVTVAATVVAATVAKKTNAKLRKEMENGQIDSGQTRSKGLFTQYELLLWFEAHALKM